MALKPNSELWNYFNNIVEEGMAECKTCKQRLRNNRSYNLKQHMKKVHNTNHEIWKYFDNYVLEGTAVCKTCKQRLKNRTCNLRIHMRRTHNVEVQAPVYDDDVEPPSSPQPYDEDQINAVLKVAKRKMNEELFSLDKRAKRRLYIKMEKKIMLRAVIGLMIEDGVSPNLFGSKNMQAILRPMCEAISDQQGKEFTVNEVEIDRILSLIANQIRNDFSNDLYWRLLSLKIDTDLNASSATFCVSALFITEGQVQIRVLGLIDLTEGQQLSEKHIQDILHKFNIDSNQIITACFDNTKSKFEKHVKNSDYLKEIENFDSYPDICLGDVKIERYIGVIAQLCLLDIFKNSEIFQLFLECRNLAKFLNDETNGYHNIFEKNDLKIPQLDSPWKSGSTYTMMHDLNQARSILEKVKFEKIERREDQFNLTDNLWSFIDAFCKSLNFIQKSIVKYYSEELHFGDFFAQWLKCKLLTEKLLITNKTKTNYITMITTELLKCIEKRSEDLLGEDRFEACLYLDPRFQRTLKLPQKNKAIEYLKKLWNRAKLYNADVVDPAVTSMEETSNAQQFEDDEDAFLNEFLSQDVQVKDTKTADVYKKIEGLKLPFQMVDTNILCFWQGQKFSEPQMHALSAICFAIPATQIFNKLRYSHICQTECNSQISAFTKENLVIIRLNASLLDDAIERLELFKDDKLSASLLSEAELSEDNDSNAASTSTAASSVVVATKTAIVQPMPQTIIARTTTAYAKKSTAIITPTGTTYLPGNITIKPVPKIE